MAGIGGEVRSGPKKGTDDGDETRASQLARLGEDGEEVDAHRSTTAIRQWLSGTAAMRERRRARVSAMAFLSETEGERVRARGKGKRERSEGEVSSYPSGARTREGGSGSSGERPGAPWLRSEEQTKVTTALILLLGPWIFR